MSRGHYRNDQLAQMWSIRECFPKFRLMMNIKEKDGSARGNQEFMFQVCAKVPRQE